MFVFCFFCTTCQCHFWCWTRDCVIDFEPCSKLEDLNLDVRRNSGDEERHLIKNPSRRYHSKSLIAILLFLYYFWRFKPQLSFIYLTMNQQDCPTLWTTMDGLPFVGTMVLISSTLIEIVGCFPILLELQLMS